MFHCAILKKTSEPSEKINRIVVATRPRTYTRRVRDEDTNQWIDIEVGTGYEIVKEVAASDAGLKAWNELSDDERDRLAKMLCRGE